MIRWERIRTLLVVVCLAIGVEVSADSLAAQQVDRAVAQHLPWSGYWWPIREGAILEPLRKHDRILGREAALWEARQYPPTPDTPDWVGYCHGTAAAGICEKEPTKQRAAVALGGERITLTIGDQKALLTACHTADVADSYGDRFGDREGSEDRQDLAPDLLWQLLRSYVKERGLPLVLDLEAGPEVWNYPVYAYEVVYRASDDPQWQEATMSLLAADSSVPPDFVGLKPRRHTYRFTFQLVESAVVMGSGRWVGRSRDDHPDFAWYPLLAVPENPQIDCESVRKLVFGGEAPGADSSDAVPMPPAPRPPLEPGPPDATPALPPGRSRPSSRADELPSPTVLPVMVSPAEGARPTGQGLDRLASGQVVLSPTELVALVANTTSSFKIDVTVDRLDGSRYRVGEPLRVLCASEREGYLYLVYLGADGNPLVLCPPWDSQVKVPAGPSIQIPEGADGRAFTVAGPPGTARIKAVVTLRPLALPGLAPGVGLSERAEGKGAATLVPKLHLPPSTADQVRELLQEYSRGESPELPPADPRTLIGDFAQDEVIFYVEATKANEKKG